VRVTSPCTFQLNQKAVIARPVDVTSLELSQPAFFGIHIRGNGNDHDGTECQCDSAAIQTDATDLVSHDICRARKFTDVVVGKRSRAHHTMSAKIRAAML
jgi:hypothetical protein